MLFAPTAVSSFGSWASIALASTVFKTTQKGKILHVRSKCSKRVCISVCTIDTEIKAKRNNMISELITFRIPKAKAKVKFGVKHLVGHECERSSVQLISIRKRKRNTPPHKTNTCRRNPGELIFVQMHAEAVFAPTRIQKIFLRNPFPHISQIVERTHFGAYTCRACIQENIPGELFMYWFRARG